MLDNTIIKRTLRVPAVTGPAGDGGGVARQMDTVLLRTGFKASRHLLQHISGLDPGVATDRAAQVLGAVRELVGDHVAHNTYFINFPDGVPDTMEFWVSCLRHALLGARVGADGGVPTDTELMATLSEGWVNLLALPTYGRYQHTYAEMLAAHDELIASVKDRVTVLHLGATLAEESGALYLQLASSPTPLNEADLALLDELARACPDAAQPKTIPIWENRAVVNAALLAAGRELVGIDTVTDVLRLACQLSDGDVSLREPTRLRRFTRPQRRVLMNALQKVIADNPAKLGDVVRHARRWQRLGEDLHPHEFPRSPHAQDVFAVARGERDGRSLAGKAELAFQVGNVGRAVEVLSAAPGMLMRQLDRVLRTCEPGDVEAVLKAVGAVTDRVSGRVLCSVREHMTNRSLPDAARLFTNRGKRAWVAPDGRPVLDPAVIGQVSAVLDDELSRRLPAHERLVVDPAVLGLAVPHSGKASEGGFGVMPRGSLTPIEGDLLRFFTYWKQTKNRTDFDLSALLLGEDFEQQGFVDWTSLSFDGATSSGDITDATGGATEFIDIPLDRISAHYVVPQVNIYSGEGFDEVAESMFGFMTRDRAQLGAPFEASTVRMRSEIRGSGQVALPVVFIRGQHDTWSAKWLHLYQRGTTWGNRVATNRVSTTLLARAIVQRDYLPVSYLVGMLRGKAGSYAVYEPGMKLADPVTFVGIDRPDGLPEGSTVITLTQLNQLIPQ